MPARWEIQRTADTEQELWQSESQQQRVRSAHNVHMFSAGLVGGRLESENSLETSVARYAIIMF